MNDVDPDGMVEIGTISGDNEIVVSRYLTFFSRESRVEVWKRGSGRVTMTPEEALALGNLLLQAGSEST